MEVLATVMGMALGALFLWLRFGGLSRLINNRRVNQGRPPLGWSESEWRDVAGPTDYAAIRQQAAVRHQREQEQHQKHLAGGHERIAGCAICERNPRW